MQPPRTPRPECDKEAEIVRHAQVMRCTNGTDACRLLGRDRQSDAIVGTDWELRRVLGVAV